MINSEGLIAIIAIFSIFIFVSLSFIVLTIINIINEKKIIKSINLLNSFDFDQKIEKLSIVADYQEKYEIVLNYSFSFKSYISEYLENIEKTMYRLRNFNKKFDVLSSLILTKRIKKEIKYLFDKINQYDSTLNSMYKNISLISDIFINNSNLYNKVANFYERHLSNEYDNETINNLFQNSRSLIKSMSKQKNECDIPMVVELQRKIISDLGNLCSLLTKIFIYNQIILYIRFNLKEISKIIISGKVNLSNQDSKIIERNRSILNDLYNSLEKDVKNLNFSNTTKIIKESSKNINIITEKMNYSIKYDSIIMEKLKKTLNYINEKQGYFADYFKKIIINFQNEEEIREKSIYLFELLNKICGAAKLLFNENHSNIPSKEKISKIIDCEIDITNFRNVVKDMNHLIVSKYNTLYKIVHDISMFKVSLANLYKMIINTSVNNEMLDIINKKLSLISSLEQKIKNDPNFTTSDSLNEQLIDLKVWIINNSLIYWKDYRLKKISEVLIVNSYNHLGQNERDDSIILKSEKLYYKNEYKKAIDLLDKKMKIFKRI